MSNLPADAILDDEEPQQWHAEPASAAAAEATAEDGGDDSDVSEAEPSDEEMGEDGDIAEPWHGASGGAAEYAARYAAALGDAGVDAPDESKVEAVDDESIPEVDETEQPQPGDLTAAFFAEMSASQSTSKKRGRPNDAGDSDDEGVVQSRAFAIPAHLVRSFDPTSTEPPASAEEYLLRVRMEAAACPRIKVSAIDPRAYAHRQTAYVPDLGAVPRPSNDACLPSAEWQNEFAADFAQARQQLLHFAANNPALRKQTHPTPTRRNYPAWIDYCVGDLKEQMTRGAAAAATSASAAAESNNATAAAASSPSAAALPHYPTLPVLVAMDQVQTKGILMQLLQLGVDTIDRRRQQAEKKPSAATDSLPPFAFPTHAYSLWAYSLLLKVDKPLSSPVSSSMRSAYRSLCWLRAHLNDPASEQVKYANLLLTLLDKSFGQGVQNREQARREKEIQRQQYLQNITPQQQWQQQQQQQRQQQQAFSAAAASSASAPVAAPASAPSQA